MKNKVTIKQTIHEMELLAKVKKCGNGAHIMLPQIMIGKEVRVYYKEQK